jgi:hypothetical protein
VFSSFLQELIRSTAGAELCATHSRPSPNASDCVQAYDHTYKGKVDLARDVTVGEPVQRSPLRWAVPYNVKDEAGNAAETVWRDVIVEEVDLSEVEAKIRGEVLQEQDIEIRKAVAKALEEDRKKRAAADATGSRGRRQPAPSTKTCPECPKCDCSGDAKFDATSCAAICETMIETCSFNDQSFVLRAMLWLEGYFPPSLIPVMLLCLLGTGFFLIVRSILTLVFNPAAYRRGYYYDGDDRRERAMQDSVTYYRSDNGNGMPNSMASPPPRASLSIGVAETFFTPPNVGISAGGSFASPLMANGGAQQPRDDLADSIYEFQPLITPSKRGDGVGKRSPHNLRR